VGAPRSESRTRAPRDGREILLAERPQRALALVRLEAVEEQHAVEVIDLVLEHATHELVGLEARVIQHEIDHLDGVLILDRTTREQRKAAMRALREAEQAAGVA